MEIITAGIPEKDDCPVLTRIKAFIVNQGVLGTLEHTIRDRKGRPVNLSVYFATPESESFSTSASGETGSVELRAKEWTGTGWSAERNPVWQIAGEAHDPEKGVVRADLEKSLVAKPGIYELSWGIRNAAGDLVMTNQGIMSVEKTLFGSLDDIKNNEGPPTINEIRMWMMDSSAAENSLLDDVEFADDQIMLALTAPIRQWNETPPPIERFTTRDFPFRGAWATGALAQLYKMAAAHYRRNFLQTSGGGVSVADKAKEREYLSEAMRLQNEYDSWLINKKVEINMKKFVGQSRSAYSGRGGW